MSVSLDAVRSREGAATTAHPVHLRRSTFVVSALLAVVSATAAALTWFWSDVLRGPPAMNGSARGTALVILVATVPLLVLAMVMAARGSVRAVFLWLGAITHLLYQSVLFLFATPLNELFLLYCAMLALSVWAVVPVVDDVDVPRLPSLFDERLPARAIAVFSWVVVLLNAALWLMAIVPKVFTDPAALLVGLGVATNPVHAQDLALWLPTMTVASWWLWQRRGRGLLLVGSVLTMWVLEPLTIAVDQWIGATADPASTVVSKAVVPIMIGMALITAIPVWFFYRSVRRDPA